MEPGNKMGTVAGEELGLISPENLYVELDVFRCVIVKKDIECKVMLKLERKLKET